jgi:LmbE family N-acetylglucosaminyl deacetylase
MFEFAGNRHLLVIAPHADDEVLGAGGLILKAARAGWEVSVLFMTVAGFRSQANDALSAAAERWAEAEAAARVLGVTNLIVCAETDPHHLRLDALAQAELVAPIERAIRDCAPGVVAFPWDGHFHQDHRATAAACIAALRPAPAAAQRPSVPVALAYGHAGGDWAAPRAFAPNHFVDLDGLLAAKLAAMSCYASQVCAFPHGRSDEGLTAWHRHWGTQIGRTFAEPFELLRYVA